MFKSTLMAVCLVASSSACSSEEASTADKCKTLVSDICTRGVACVGGTQQDCVVMVGGDFQCDSVQQVSSTYDQCIDEVNTAECSALFPVDSSGQAMLVVPPACVSVVSR